MNEEFRRAVESLIEQLLRTPEYEAYARAKERVEGDEECLNKIRRFRQLSIEIQNYSDEQRIREGARIETECDRLLEDPRVMDTMEAETDLVRMYQYVISRMIEAIELED